MVPDGRRACIPLGGAETVDPRFAGEKSSPISMAAMTSGDDVLTILLADYLPADAVERSDVDEIERLAATGSEPWSQDLPLHLTASALVVDLTTGRLLLRWHARQQAWLQVGGHGEPGEREPLQVALREGHEETGLTDLKPWPNTALLHAVVVPVQEKGESPAHRHADLRFVLATEHPDEARAERPDAPLRWVTVDEALSLTAEENLRETIRRLHHLVVESLPG